MTRLITHADPWRYKTNNTKAVTSEEKYIYFWYKNAAFSKFTFLWARTCKHLSPHSWDQKQVKVTVYNEVGKGKMILFQTVLTLCWLLTRWDGTGELKENCTIYIEEPSQWQGYNMYMAPLTLHLHFKVRGRERILHLCGSTKENPPPPKLAHITLLSPAWRMSKQDRQKAQCWSLYRREYIQLPASCPVSRRSYLQGRGEGVTLEHLSLSTAGHRRGSSWHSKRGPAKSSYN